MAFKEKNYVDLTGLGTFVDSLKAKLSNNSTTVWSVNYANSAMKAIQDSDGRVITDTYLTIDDANTGYVPLTRTIADIVFNKDITTEELQEAVKIGIAAQVSEYGDNYIKLSNGLGVCWGGYRGNEDLTFSEWGSSYKATSSKEVTFPFRFGVTPNVFMSSSLGAEDFIITDYTCSKTGFGNLSISKATSSSGSFEMAFNYVAIGSLIEPPTPIGGKIFYDAGDNGATYTFYDSSGNVVSDTSISGLQNAVSYKVEGTPSPDRFYVVYPEMLNSGNKVYWGFYRNADIKSSGGNIVNTGTGIGTGKTATQAILNYIDTYASNETASSSRPNPDISQSSPNGYNLYKNCGTDYSYLWDVVRDANNTSLEGHNDWFIPSKDEMYQLGTSGVISDITGSNYIWLGSAYSTSSHLAWYWNYYNEGLYDDYRDHTNRCVVCRAF